MLLNLSGHFQLYVFLLLHCSKDLLLLNSHQTSVNMQSRTWLVFQTMEQSFLLLQLSLIFSLHFYSSAADVLQEVYANIISCMNSEIELPTLQKKEELTKSELSHNSMKTSPNIPYSCMTINK